MKVKYRIKIYHHIQNKAPEETIELYPSAIELIGIPYRRSLLFSNQIASILGPIRPCLMLILAMQSDLKFWALSFSQGLRTAFTVSFSSFFHWPNDPFVLLF